MTDRTTSRVIPRPEANDSIPVLTEVFELPADEPGQGPEVSEAREAAEAAEVPEAAEGAEAADVAQPRAEPEVGLPDGPTDEDLRAVRTELLSRVMMRFRAEWPPLVQAQTEAALQERLAPLATQIANELSRALEARLVEWLDATLEDIERDPGAR